MGQLIDAHPYFWSPRRENHNWARMVGPKPAPTEKPIDLRPHLAKRQTGATVLIQGADTVGETEDLLARVDQDSRIAGVIGWMDFQKSDHYAGLERLAAHPKFRGVRPVVQDVDDVDWMLRDNAQYGFQTLIDLNLTLDLLGFARHLTNYHEILTWYPEMRVVIDCCLKQTVGSHHDDFGLWADGMARLALDTGAYCKLSGLTFGADHPGALTLCAYAEHMFMSFGPARVMWGTDWPECQVRADYPVRTRVAETLGYDLKPEERARVFGGTATAFYCLTD